MKISSISTTNEALLNAVKNSNTHVVDDEIDDIEIVKFKQNADEIWRSHRCTNDEYKAIFGFQPKIEDFSFEGRLGEINSKISKNLSELKHIEYILKQDEIDYQDYAQDMNSTSNVVKKTIATLSIGSLITSGLGFMASMDGMCRGSNQTVFEKFLGNHCGKFAIAGLGFMLLATGINLWQNHVKGKKPEIKTQMQEYYQNEFNRLMEENRKLTAEFDKLSAKSS